MKSPPGSSPSLMYSSAGSSRLNNILRGFFPLESADSLSFILTLLPLGPPLVCRVFPIQLQGDWLIPVLDVHGLPKLESTKGKLELCLLFLSSSFGKPEEEKVDSDVSATF
ncbi:hypothetical protein PRUPE_3G261000 [Prunus persica]|uniref:Uncharacterized protein n=1 Tax=Prunus persica TaxID=3760 RepID=A0A251Q8Z7_PRUPE|nr:hypothetical protein PRUPE_3G261000 [Prunus persica]